MTKDDLRRWLKLAEQERDGARVSVDWAGTFAQALNSWPDEPTRDPLGDPKAVGTIPFVHWSKDPLIPYTGCGCPTCQDMRRYRGDAENR